MPIYRDCLGNPDATANISVFGASYGNPGTGYLSLSATSDCPQRKWDYVSRDVSEIVAQMDAEGWHCTVDKDGYNAPIIRCTHIETRNHIDMEKAKDDVTFKNAERGFIRFGDCPKDGKSFNHRDRVYEDGVSVFEAEFAGKDYRLLFDNHVLMPSYLSVCDRPAYRIYGDVIGTGADGEPLIKVSKAVKL